MGLAPALSGRRSSAFEKSENLIMTTSSCKFEVKVASSKLLVTIARLRPSIGEFLSKKKMADYKFVKTKKSLLDYMSIGLWYDAVEKLKSAG